MNKKPKLLNKNLNQLFQRMNNIFQDKNQFSLLKILMVMDFTHGLISENTQDTITSFNNLPITLVDSIKDGSIEFNIKLMLMFTISNSKLHSFLS